MAQIIPEVQPNPFYALFFVGKGAKITENNFDGTAYKVAQLWDKKNGKKIKAICMTALPRVKRGLSVQLSTATERVFLRPIKADKASCLSCHAGAKMGETLGAMVYTVSLNSPLKQVSKKVSKK